MLSVKHMVYIGEKMNYADYYFDHPARKERAIQRFIKSIFLGTTLLFFTGIVQAKDLPDFSSLVEKYGAAVVNISTTQKIKHPVTRIMPHNMPEQLPEGPLGDLFKHFFGDPGGNGGEEDLTTQSLGSGFILSDDGYIITNRHVIKDATEVVVKLTDRRELEASIVGSDERSDVALLKVDAENLPVVSIGNSEKLKVGEWVLAIGSPFGFDHSVTAGIVSAKGRSLPKENYVPFIQTDVAINPGNSGGPLFDLDGNVVGVNSQIFGPNGSYLGISFAIPIDIVMQVVDQLKSTGHVARGWLGVLIQDVTKELAESFGMDKPRGALVAKVMDGSPAEKAGFEVGDVVTRFNGVDIKRSANLPPLVGVSPVGKNVKVEVLRKGKTKTLQVKLGELPEEDVQVASEGTRNTDEGRLNIVVSDLTAEQREKLEIKEGGVVVTNVQAGPARKAGVRRGDVILTINNIDIKDAKHFKDIADDLPTDKSVPLLVQRRGGPVFLALKVKDE